MVFEHIGHAEFLITLDNGLRLVTDPYDESCGYPVRKLQADAVCISHHHHDHDALQNVTGAPRVLSAAGRYTLCPGVSVSALLSDHDGAGGSQRGKTLLFLMEAEGLRVAHLGDLGRLPNGEELAYLSPVDVLMIPVGGYYTIDAPQAKTSAEALQARVILPMHYRTEANRDWPIAPLADFTALYPAGDVQAGGEVLRLTAADLACHKKVVCL